MTGIIEVFILDVELAEGLSPAERNKNVSREAHEFVRRHIAAAGNMEQERLIFSKGSSGKPFAVNSGMKYNISHCGNVAAVAFSDEEVGVDIEKVRKYPPLVPRRFFTEGEKEYLDAARDTDENTQRFFAVWTAKEAYLKLHGAGIGGGLDFETADGNGMKPIIQSRHYPAARLSTQYLVITGEDAGESVFCLSVCSQSEKSVRIRW